MTDSLLPQWRLKPLEFAPQPCLCCPPRPVAVPMDVDPHPGFGGVSLHRDGVGVPGTECQMHTTDEGRTLDRDGDPIPFDQRPRECGAGSRWMLGNVFLCQQHAAETAHLMDDDIGEIEKEWRAQL